MGVAENEACKCGMSRRRLLGAAGAAAATVAGAGACVNAEGRPKPQDVRRGRVVAQTGEVPVGGGLVVMDSKLVITQPEEGDYRAYSAICSHQGCTVQEVTHAIRCWCHTSEFDLETGEPLSGPATEPLEPFTVTVDGTDIILD